MKLRYCSYVVMFFVLQLLYKCLTTHFFIIQRQTHNRKFRSRVYKVLLLTNYSKKVRKQKLHSLYPCRCLSFHALRRPTYIARVTWNPATKVARLLRRNKCGTTKVTCVSWP